MIIRLFISVIVFLLYAELSLCQYDGTLYSDTIYYTGTSTISPVYPVINANHKIKSAKLFISVEPKSSRYIYLYPSSILSANFNIVMGGSSLNHNINIGGSVAQKLVVEDISFSTPGNFTIGNLNTFTIAILGGALPSDLELKVWYEIIAGVDQISPGPEIIDFYQNVILGDSIKTISVEWTDINYQPFYELQILKLPNESPGLDEYQTVEVQWDNDWDKALSIIVDGDENSISLSVGEGTGLYKCRIRPIGTFYSGGISDFRNLGTWDIDPQGVVTYDVLDIPTNPNLTFFRDPDEDKNWIYNRVFTEKSRIKENYTIADPLLNVRQSQTNIPSQDVILITESQLDFIGRPSMSAIPVPISNENGLSFQNKFFQPSGITDSLYRSDHFDDDSNLFNPNKVDDTAKGYMYYSNNNPDLRIPSGEGYPFSRTLYERDPTNRIREQSGVGITHMLDEDQSNGRGRTVRTYYGVASESELIRIMGDEAPRASSVTKTITLDQNNVGQILYTNLQGETLATALVDSIEDFSSDNLLPLNHYANDGLFTANDTLKHNIVAANGFHSSKRFVLMHTTPFEFSYILNCPELNLACHNALIDCNWKLEVRLLNVHDSTFVTINQTFDLRDSICSNDEIVVHYSFPDPLPPGTYIIEKNLSQSDSLNVEIEDARDSIELQIYPIVNKIMSELDSICSLDDIDDFYDFIMDFTSDINDAALGIISNNDLISLYNLNPDFRITQEHSANLIVSNGTPQTLILGSNCCVGIQVDVAYVPPFKCPDNYNINVSGTPTVNLDFRNSDWPVDFEGYAINLLYNKCGFSSVSEAADTLYNSLEGWGPGEFNWMVHHMLTDTYNCNGIQSNENPSTEPTIQEPNEDCPFSGIGGVGNTCDLVNQDDCTQYNCQDLFYCWQSIIETFIVRKCSNLDSLYKYTNTNSTISDAIDDENNEDPNDPNDSNDHDDHIDDNMSGFMKFVMWLTGASKKVRDAQDDMTQVGSGGNWGEITSQKINLAKEFLDCAGYRFNDIVGPGNVGPLLADINAHNAMSGMTSGFNPINIDGWSPIDPYDQSKKLFALIPNNIFAFKYFYYEGHNGNEDLIAMEVQTCYNEPAPCFDGTTQVPCDFCDFGIIECDVTHQDWSCGQRYTFYRMLKNYRSPSNQNSVTYENFDCTIQDTLEKYLIPEVESMQNQCLNICESKRSIFRNELIKVLRERCYNIGACRAAGQTANVPWEDVDVMVDQLVEQCKSQCEITTYTCLEDRQCIATIDAFNPSRTYYTQSQLLIGVGGSPLDDCTGQTITNDSTVTVTECYDPNFSYCDLTELEQAMGWRLEIEIESQCPTGTPGSIQKYNCATTSDHFCVDRDLSSQVYSPYNQNLPLPGDTTGVKELIIITN